MLQQIQNKLCAINDTVFQELCDSLLFSQNDNYKVFSRTGSQACKQKTIKGTPDCVILLPTNKYRFIEYSTNITKGVNKLIDDLKKCIDVNKTDVPPEDIAEIIICINFNLDTKDIQKLKGVLTGTRIELKVHTLDSLSLELNLYRRDLAHHYLGLPLTTGQIVSTHRFIEEYNKASQGMATPLDNPFLHREKELSDLSESLTHNDCLILYGAPGVGKTKLALKVIEDFKKENHSYDVYCISYKNADLLEDLHLQLNLEHDYILFVDDANRIDAFKQIIGFYSVYRTGKLKLVVTVRDYAFQLVNTLCSGFLPVSYPINKLTDEQLIDIVKEEPFNILNSIYHKQIIRIADGNPRLAIMAALIAKEKQTLASLDNVGEMFERYYSTLIRDNQELTEPKNIKILGLIAFFHAVPCKDKDAVNSILTNFYIEYEDFIDRIERLERLEIVEIQYGYAKISEQNFSIYLFYKSFLKERLLSFETLLEKFFYRNTAQFDDCIIPANNIFGYQNVMKKVQPILKKHFLSIHYDYKKCLILFSNFWFYLRDEVLEFVFATVDQLPDHPVCSYQVTGNSNDHAYNQDKIIELLGHLFQSSDKLKDALELSFNYCRKLPEHLPELLSKIKEKLTFDYKDENFGFARQRILFQLLIEGLNRKDPLFSKVFFELSKNFLEFKYQQVEAGRNNSISFYYYLLPTTHEILELRGEIWKNIGNNFSDDAFGVLKEYASLGTDAVIELMSYDLSFVCSIINEHLSPASFKDCKYVHELLKQCEYCGVHHQTLENLSFKFNNQLYDTFLKISLSRLEGKDIEDYSSYEEFMRLKEREIRKNFVFNSKALFREFYFSFLSLRRVDDRGREDYNYVLDLIIDENLRQNFSIGCQLLAVVIENDSNFAFTPNLCFKNYLISREKVSRIWNIIQTATDYDKPRWELAFYTTIADAFITGEYINAIRDTVRNLKNKSTISFLHIAKLVEKDSQLFYDLLKIIVERNEKKDDIYVWYDIFDNYSEHPDAELLLLKKAYLQQVIKQNIFDFSKRTFLSILIKDQSLLCDYIKTLYLGDISARYLRKIPHLDVVWKVGDIERSLSDVFDFVSTKELYLGIGEHFCNAFFKNLEGTEYERAKQFLLDYSRANFHDIKKINMVVNITFYTMKTVFGLLLGQFITLTQNVELFSHIHWIKSSTVYRGDTIVSVVNAEKWQNVLSIINKSSVGYKLIPIKQYVRSKIDENLRHAEEEKKERFIDL